MSLLPAVIVAQVLTAEVGDRVELREVVEVTYRQFEAENSAYATVGLSYPWLTATLTYSPSVVLAPLESTPRTFRLTNTVNGVADSTTTLYEASRFKTTLRLTATYTQYDYGRSLINAPLPASAQPPSDPETPPDASSAQAIEATGDTTRSGTAESEVTFTEALSRRGTLAESVGYTAGVGLDEESRLLFPFAHGPTASLSYTYVFSPRNMLTSELEGSVVFVPSRGGRAYRGDYEERLIHLFNRRTYSEFSLGVAYTRAENEGQPVEGITPTAEAALTTGMKAAGGDLSLGFRILYGPTLDRTALVFDPRVGVEGNIGWTKRRFSAFASTSTSVSVSPDDPGSLSGASGELGVRYDLGAGFTADAGLRFVWQQYNNQETLPPTSVAFIGLGWGYELL
jgi:hypothetical protein